MALINITVQSLLNAAQYDSYTIDDTSLVNELKSNIQTETGCDVTWFELVFNSQVLDIGASLADYSIVEGSVLRTANQIARLPTLQDRQVAKLNLSHLERLELGNPRAEYDIEELPTHYEGNDVVDNPNPDGLIEGRPWLGGGPPPPPSSNFTLNWYGTITQPTPNGTYTGVPNGTTLDSSSYFDVGSPLSSTTFTITVDANMGLGGSGVFWNSMWANESWLAGVGPIAYWNGPTTLNFGTPADVLNCTTPDITQNVRRLYTFVMNGSNVDAYINGSSVGSGTLSVVPAIASTNFFIGARHMNDGSSSPSDAQGGTYYSVKVEATALTAVQVAAAYVIWQAGL